MNATHWLVAVTVLVAVALAGAAIVILKKDALNATLGSLISLMGSTVASLRAPSLDGAASIQLDLGPLHAAASQMKVNTSEPQIIWLVAFVTLGILIGIGMGFVGMISYRTRTFNLVSPVPDRH